MTIPVHIELSGTLTPLGKGSAAKTLREHAKLHIRDLAERLGLGAPVTVRISQANAPRPLRVLVNGRAAPYPPDLLWRHSAGVPDGGSRTDNGVGHSITGDALAALCENSECSPAEVAALVVDMVRDRPSLLVNPAQAASYLAAAGGGRASETVIHPVLTALLELGVAPLPRETVIDAVASSDDRVEDAVEAVFAALQGRRVEIAVSPEYRRVLTSREGRSPELVSDGQLDPRAKQLFELLEKRLLVEWGLILPDLVWTTHDDLPDGMIAVKVNDRRCFPVQCLSEGERIVLADSVSEVTAAGMEPKRVVVNPANASLDLAIVDAAAESQGDSLAIAPPAGFAALVVYRELVSNAHRLLGTEQTLYLLQDYQSRSPELVHLVLRHFTVAEITGVLRALVRERIPPRLLPVVLERLARLVIKPVLPEARVESVRRGLSDYILHRFARGDQARTFFEFSSEVEQAIGARMSGDLELERLRDATWSTLRANGIPPVRAGVLVRRAPRGAVYEALAPELPEIVVIKRSELAKETPDVAATISLDQG